MQGVVPRFETNYASSVSEVMEKRGEIPGKAPGANAPSRSDVERVRKRVEQLGVDFHEAIEKADLSRPTGFRLLKGEGSLASLRKLDEWAAREEQRTLRQPAMTVVQQDAALQEWARIGEELHDADPARFATTLDGLRDVLESVKLQRSAFAKMFRANPDPRR